MILSIISHNGNNLAENRNIADYYRHIAWVLGLKAIISVFFIKSFYGCLIFNECNNKVAVSGILCFLGNNKFTV